MRNHKDLYKRLYLNLVALQGKGYRFRFDRHLVQDVTAYAKGRDWPGFEEGLKQVAEDLEVMHRWFTKNRQQASDIDDYYFGDALININTLMFSVGKQLGDQALIQKAIRTASRPSWFG